MKKPLIEITDPTKPIYVLISKPGANSWSLKCDYGSLRNACLSDSDEWKASDDEMSAINDAKDASEWDLCIRLLASALHDKFDVFVTSNPQEWE